MSFFMWIVSHLARCELTSKNDPDKNPSGGHNVVNVVVVGRSVGPYFLPINAAIIIDISRTTRRGKERESRRECVMKLMIRFTHVVWWESRPVYYFLRRWRKCNAFASINCFEIEANATCFEEQRKYILQTAILLSESI